MARFSRLAVYNAIVETGLVPVFNHADERVAGQVLQAVAAGGLRVFEFTNRGQDALEVFRELAAFARRETPDVILGAGTIADEPAAALYIAAGANFVVGPVLNASVARLCNRRKIAYLPGCGTATEIAQAEELGAEIVKVFPADAVGGPEFVRAILGPCPWTRMLVSGGVQATPADMQAWFGAGVTAVGIGTKLIRPDLLKANDYDAITAQVAQTLTWIRAARG